MVAFRWYFDVIFCRNSQYEDDELSQWDFHLTVREAEPTPRSTILETAQKPIELNHPVKDPTPQNHMVEVLTSSSAGSSSGQQQEGSLTSESNRLSNGVSEPNMIAAGTASIIDTSLALQDARLSTLSTESNTSLSNGFNFSVEDKVATSGESSTETVVDTSSVSHNRHESIKSISEETRELDEFLNRSSVTSVLTESQVSSIQGSSSHEAYERVGSGGEEDSERGGSAAEDFEEMEVRETLIFNEQHISGCVLQLN